MPECWLWHGQMLPGLPGLEAGAALQASPIVPLILPECQTLHEAFSLSHSGLECARGRSYVRPARRFTREKHYRPPVDLKGRRQGRDVTRLIRRRQVCVRSARARVGAPSTSHNLQA